MKIKTIKSGSAIVGAVAAAGAAATALLCGTEWWVAAVLAAVLLAAGYSATQVIVQQFVIHKLRPIYQLVFSKDMLPKEPGGNYESATDMVDKIENELTDWAETNRKVIARLKENEKYRKDYIGNVSHEIKTPIFNIQGYISTLLAGGLDDDSINRDYLERAEKSIDRLINIVTDLDEISKLEAGVLQLHIERFDAAALARECADSVEMESERKNIAVSVGETSFAPLQPVYVRADRHHIMQVFINLIMNSIRYGREGGRTTVTFTDLFDMVMIEVADNGIGISGVDIPRIFERFYRTDKGRSREQGGTGLGLSIVKHIVEAHGQTIKVRSAPGEGTIFSFTLPRG